MNFGHLAIFHAVAETGSVTGGAERAGVSQPAVSKQVKELERALGVALLQRHGRGVCLTEAGRVLASYATRIFALAEEAEVALDDLGALRRGTLCVGATPTIGTYVLPEVLVYFRQRFPGIRVTVRTADGPALAERVGNGEIGLALGDETLTLPGMQRRRFAVAQFVAVAHPKHPLVRRRRVTLADFAAEPLVTRAGDGSSESSLVERYLAEAGVAPVQAVALGSTEAVKRAVQAGLGVAIVPRLAVEGEVSARRLAILRIPELSLARPLYEVWDARRPWGKAAQAFHCVLEHSVRGTLPDRRRQRATQPAR